MSATASLCQRDFRYAEEAFGSAREEYSWSRRCLCSAAFLGASFKCSSKPSSRPMAPAPELAEGEAERVAVVRDGPLQIIHEKLRRQRRHPRLGSDRWHGRLLGGRTGVTASGRA